MSLLKLLFGNTRKTKGRKRRRGTVDFNAFRIRRKYPLSKHGYFGVSGENRRVIYANNHHREAKSFFSKLSRGGRKKDALKKKTLRNNIDIRVMRDGGHVTYREKTSTPNSPAVDLGRLTGKVKNQRIHFLKKEKK
ncbi:MAG: hypothetical protein IJW43_06095 [Clostridia bacterium]|nr:hypothetical protein [Clostridia bacterium]